MILLKWSFSQYCICSASSQGCGSIVYICNFKWNISGSIIENHTAFPLPMLSYSRPSGFFLALTCAPEQVVALWVALTKLGCHKCISQLMLIHNKVWWVNIWERSCVLLSFPLEHFCTRQVFFKSIVTLA